MGVTNKQLREVIRAALDCPSHFHKPTIINNDDFFSFGADAIVICDTCVQRMRKSLGLNPNDSVPTAFQLEAQCIPK